MDTTDWTVDDHIEWQRHQAKTLAVMDRLWLNRRIATMCHYGNSLIKTYEMSPHLDAIAVQKDLLDLGPNPVLVRKAEEREAMKGVCQDCGGTENKHYLDCSVWPFNKERS